ncbi:SpoIVB peptidase S55 domain-containing protein [Sporosarcina sp. JAI121]|uniref:SpoIVB peptidase S55 domain-containing protein n=1 Tax=Sporosarcina sp. JAI121 TaxID=2723064 RepID=UPI0015CB2A89|nr:SpoIVB peptidase S55 domain-containing protein [Sporosarcina sp. JAI121]NYF24630.1 stage IV sporulation protein B [Sporosarcina sp. JAI121]
MGWSRQFKLAVSLSVLFLFMPFTTDAAFAKDGSLIPMGQSIGIKMELSGVYITNDIMISKDNWLKAGDLIGQVDNVAISTLHEFEKKSTSWRDKKEIVLHVIRNGDESQFQADGEAMKRLIPFLKDRTEGTGTLTYVDPDNGTYGALGHQIIDSALKSPPSFKSGSIYLSEIDQIKKSVPGIPGYKISTIVDGDDVLGSIRINGIYGIFGAWSSDYKKVLAEPLQIMQPAEVEVGPAEIYTTIKGVEVEAFSIRITEVEHDQFHFILTDQKLLAATGGILQGMSGSPVIQNGKFAGAVTHMFVDDPKKGAGLYLEKMRSGEK